MKKKCDVLFSKKVRSVGYCQFSGKSPTKCGGQLQCCHIEARDNLRLRWEPQNVLCLCYAHHTRGHRRPLEFIEVIQEYYPEKWKYVMTHKNEIAHSIDYEALYKMIQEWKLYELT
jgi:hypothetical protein